MLIGVRSVERWALLFVFIDTSNMERKIKEKLKLIEQVLKELNPTIKDLLEDYDKLPEHIDIKAYHDKMNKLEIISKKIEKL